MFPPYCSVWRSFLSFHMLWFFTQNSLLFFLNRYLKSEEERNLLGIRQTRSVSGGPCSNSIISAGLEFQLDNHGLIMKSFLWYKTQILRRWCCHLRSNHGMGMWCLPVSHIYEYSTMLNIKQRNPIIERTCMPIVQSYAHDFFSSSSYFCGKMVNSCMIPSLLFSWYEVR